MKTPIETIRRRELSEAAFEVMKEHGLSGTTVARVAERAGMSQGLVHHYFKGKSDMLEGAIWQVTQTFRQRIVDAACSTEEPESRLHALIEALYPVDHFDQSMAQAWLSSCGEAAFNEAYARLQRILFNRMQSNFSFHLRQFLEPDAARRAARMLCMQSHGIWLRCAIDRDGISRDDAVAQMKQLLATLIGRSAA